MMNQQEMDQVEQMRRVQIEYLCEQVFYLFSDAHKAGVDTVEILRTLSIITGAIINEFPDVTVGRSLFNQLLDASIAKAAKHWPHPQRPAAPA